jgi:hypothetical protein
MAIAPEPLLSAYLAVLRDATIYARNGAVGDISPEKLGDLMDAVHNIPELLNRWEECDEPSLRSALESYDKRFRSAESTFRLCRESETQWRNRL